MKKIKIVLGIAIVSLVLNTTKGWAASTITTADGGTNMCVPGLTYKPIGDILIAEGAATDFEVTANRTLVLTAPVGFEFNPGTGTVTCSGLSGGAIAATIAVTSTSVTVGNMTFAAGIMEYIRISGVEVKALNGATSGNIYRLSSNSGNISVIAGSATSNTDGSGGTSYGFVSALTLNGGTIATAVVNPLCSNKLNTLFSSTAASTGGDCSAITYDWEKSLDYGTTWSSLGANTLSFTNVAGITQNTFFRRKASDGTNSAFSNVIVILTATAPPVAMYGLPATSCTDNSPITLTGFPAGGTFSGSIGLSLNIYSPSVAGVGVHNLTYKFTDGNGCSNEALASNTVSAAPTIDFTVNGGALLSSYANNDIAAYVCQGIINGVNENSGVFSGPGIINTYDFRPNLVGTTGVITLSYTAGGICPSVKSYTTTITPPSTLITNLPVQMCLNSSVIGNVTGIPNYGLGYFDTQIYNNTLGVYVPADFSTNTTGLQDTMRIDPAVLGAGVFTVTYNKLFPVGVETQNFTINSLPSPITISNLAASYCNNDTTSYIITGSPLPPAIGLFSSTIGGEVNFGNGTAAFKPSAALPAAASVNNISAAWPNSAWLLTGAYTPAGLLKNPTTTSTRFTWDDDVLTSSNISAINAESPVIDINAAFLAGQTEINVTVNYTYRIYAGETLALQWWDAVGLSWNTWHVFPSNATSTFDYRNNINLKPFASVVLDISGFSLAQRTGFKYRIMFNDNGSWGFGFCFDAPRLISTTPPIPAIKYTYTSAVTGCSNSKTNYIKINANPTVSFSGLDSKYCVNNSLDTLSGIPLGGTFSCSVPSALSNKGSGIATFNPGAAAIVPGNKIYFTYSYNDPVTGCPGSKYDSTIVNSLPVISFTGLVSDFCINSSPVLLAGVPAGGVFSGANVTSIGSFDPTLSGTGSKTVFYVYTNTGTGCVKQVSNSTTIRALPTPSFGPSALVANFCINGPTVLFTGTPAGGVFSGDNVTSAGSFNPQLTGLGAKTYTYTYTSAFGCVGSVTRTRNVEPYPTVNISSGMQTQFCVNAADVTLVGNQGTSGVFSGNGVTDNGNGTALFSPSILPTGPTKVFFSYTDPTFGCTKKDTSTTMINPLPSSIDFSGLGTAYCNSYSSAVTLTDLSPMAGHTSTFYGYGVVDDGNNTSGTFTPSVASAAIGGGNVVKVDTVFYSYTLTSTGCTIIVPKQITLNVLPNVTINNLPTATCINGSPINLLASPTSGGAGTFSGPGISGVTFTPSIAGLGTKTIKFKYTLANTCVDSVSQNINVQNTTLITFSGLNPTQSYCVNNPTITFYAAPGNGNGSFSAGNGLNNQLNFNDSTSIDFTPSTSGVNIGNNVFTYNYTDPITACSSSNNITIIVNNTPQSIDFAGLNPGLAYCNSNSTVVNLTNTGALPLPAASRFSGPGVVNGAVGAGTFTPTLAAAFLGAGNNLITTPITYSYTDAFGCKDSITKNVTLNVLPTPSIATTVAGSNVDSTCVNNPSITLTGTPSGTNFTTASAGLFGSTFNPALAGVGTHKLTFHYTIPATGCTDSVFKNVKINGLTPVTFSGTNISYCVDAASDILLASPGNGNGYFSGNGIFNYKAGAPDSITFVPSALGVNIGNNIITYTYTNPATLCTSSADTNIIVNALPTGVDFSGLNGGLAYCNSNNSIINLTNITPAATHTGIFTGNGIVDGGDNNTATFNPNTAYNTFTQDNQLKTTTITYTYTNANGCTFVKSKVVTLNILPEPVIFSTVLGTNIDSTCINNPNVTLTGSPSGAGYVGSFSSTNAAALSGNIFNPGIAGPGSYTLKYFSTISATGCTDSISKVIKVFNTTPITLTGLNSGYCRNDAAVSLIATPGNNNGYFTGNGLNALSYNYTATNATEDFYPSNIYGAIIGTNKLTYTYTDPLTLCTSKMDTNIVVHPMPPTAFNTALGVNRYCFDAPNDITLKGTPNPSTQNGKGTSSFTAVNGGLLNVVLSTGDAHFDPSAVTLLNNFYPIIYSYTDSFNCTTTSTRNFQVDSLPNANFSISGNVFEYCTNTPAIPNGLIPVVPGGTFFVDGNSISGTTFTPAADPNYVKIPPAAIPVRYDFTDGNGCFNTSTLPITVYKLPVVGFSTSYFCNTFPAQFSNASNTDLPDVITKYNWKFESPSTAPSNISSAFEPSHRFLNAGTYTVVLTDTTLKGCVNSLSQNITFFAVNPANFEWDNECFINGTAVNLTDLTSSSNPREYYWNFGDASSGASNTSTIISGGLGLASTTHNFTAVGDYYVRLVVSENNGCVDTSNQVVHMRPIITPTKAQPYFEDFESGKGSWVSYGYYRLIVNNPDFSTTVTTIDSTSWAHGSPTKISSPNTSKCWATKLNGTYYDNEVSYVNGPCFDLSKLKKPMIKFRYWCEVEEGGDGACLQYSDDNRLTWKSLGTLSSGGLNWFNQGVGSLASSHAALEGWSSASSNGWVDARHSLDTLIGKSNVSFRIAFASNNATKFKGFAFDDIWIGERGKMLLAENFTNSADANSVTNNAKFNAIMDRNPYDAVDIQYHIGYPGIDPMHQANVSDPNARSLYYGVSAPSNLLFEGNQYKGRTELFSDVQLKRRTLEDAKFDISLVTAFNAGTYSVSSSIVSNFDLPNVNDVTVYIALIEKSVTTGGLPTYQSVLKKMLPNAAGTNFKQTWSKGSTQNITASWQAEGVFDYNQLFTIVFVQDNVTKEIYQAATNDASTIPTSIIADVLTEDGFNFNLMPNPAGDLVRLVLNKPATKSLTLKVYNYAGTLVISDEVKAGIEQVELNTAKFAGGMYFVQLMEGENVINKKLVIVH